MEIGLRGTVEWRIWLLLSLLAGGARAEVDYRRDVKPILQARCVSCHGPRRQEGGLRLDTAAALRRGGNEGPALIAGQAAVSLIVLRVTDPDPAARMPQEAKPLLPREIRILRSWIDSGATAPADEVPVEETDHWAFQSVSRPALEGPFASTSDNPIDAWIDAEHRRRGLSAVPLADPPTVLRRVSLDLVGLAPRRDRLHRFTDDTAPDAYQRLVDELLASPRYAERWGRHWMDVWRYSDRFGVLGQRSQDHIWQWRDWILDALNADQGYDQMIASMLAADELTPTDRGALRATGFVARNYFHFNRDVWLDATVEHTAKAFLALTLNCCRCHDHKFDPLRQRDYYAFRAIFEPHRIRIDRFPGGPDEQETRIPRIFDADPGAPTWLYQGGDAKRPDTERAVTAGPPGFLDFVEYAAAPVDLPQASYYPALDKQATAERVAAARGAVARAETALADGDDPVGRQRLASARAELAALQARIAAERARHAQPRSTESGQLSQAAAVAEGVAVRASAELDVLVAETEFAASLDVSGEAARGRVLAAETQLTEAWDRLEALPEDSREATGYSHLGRIYSAVSSGRRGALAAWITHPRNPLTARVAVNHVWLRHFGEPLVSTVFDFGRNGSRPSHPKLLDWLASAFVEHDWSMKWLHRVMVGSRAYRRSSSSKLAGVETLAADPSNRWLWRANPRRMESQLIRDNLFYLCGRLEERFGGAEIDPQKMEEVARRSLYFRHSEKERVTFLALFDDASVNECYRRQETIVPQQALAMANSRLVTNRSRELAGLLPGEETAFVRAAFETVLTRSPTDAEQRACRSALARMRRVLSARGPADGAQRARQYLIHVLLNHNDFLTIR